MKHKLLQTWARKSAKLLAAFTMLALGTNAAHALEAELTNTGYTNQQELGTKKQGWSMKFI